MAKTLAYGQTRTRCHTFKSAAAQVRGNMQRKQQQFDTGTYFQNFAKILFELKLFSIFKPLMIQTIGKLPYSYKIYPTPKSGQRAKCGEEEEDNCRLGQTSSLRRVVAASLMDDLEPGQQPQLTTYSVMCTSW